MMQAVVARKNFIRTLQSLLMFRRGPKKQFSHPLLALSWFCSVDLKERLIVAASSYVQVCKLLPSWVTKKDAKKEAFDELVQLYQSVLADGDLTEKFPRSNKKRIDY